METNAERKAARRAMREERAKGRKSSIQSKGIKGGNVGPFRKFEHESQEIPPTMVLLAEIEAADSNIMLIKKAR